MGSRLSSLLIERGVLSVGELKTAFNVQVIKGGTLDTALLEKRVVEEATLLETLSDACGYPPMTPELLGSCSSQAADAIDQQTAERLGICPISRSGDQIVVLTSERTDPGGLEELAFELRCQLLPFVATEVRVQQAAASVYGAPLPTRHQQLLESLGSEPPPAELSPHRPGNGDAEQPYPDAPANRVKTDRYPVVTHPSNRTEPLPQTSRTAGSAPAPVVAEEPIVVAPPAPAPAPEPEPTPELEAARQEPAPTKRRSRRRRRKLEALSAPFGTAEMEAQQMPRQLTGLPLDSALEALAAADDREQALIALLRGAHFHLNTIQLYVVRGDELHGRLAIEGSWFDDEDVERRRLTLTVPSVVARAVASHSPYLGPVPDSDASTTVLLAAEIVSDNVVVIPVALRGRPICVMLGHHHGYAPDARQPLTRLAEATATRIAQLIVLSKRLRAEDDDESTPTNEVPVVAPSAAAPTAEPPASADAAPEAAPVEPASSVGETASAPEAGDAAPEPEPEAALDERPQLAIEAQIEAQVGAEIDAQVEAMSAPAIESAATPVDPVATPVDPAAKARAPRRGEARGPRRGGAAERLAVQAEPQARDFDDDPTLVDSEPPAGMVEDLNSGLLQSTSGEIDSPPPDARPDLDQPKVIVEMGPDLSNEPTEAVVAALREGGATTRAALDALKRRGKEAITALIAIFPGKVLVRPADDPLPPAPSCGPVLAALASLGRPVLPSLAPLLNSENPDVRFFATYLLSELVYPEAVSLLASKLRDSDPQVRRAAIKTMRRFREMEAYPELLDHLRSDLTNRDPRARRAAADALAALGDVVSTPSIVAMLRDDVLEVCDTARLALVLLTKQDFGSSSQQWMSWWQRNRHRHRIEWLIDGLVHDSPEIRADSVGELKETTGVTFGYRHDMPPQEREEIRRRFLVWWADSGLVDFGRFN